ncbi:hypothetical protein ABPG72_008957 [Tetrahymena utriculariae]
MNPNQDQHFQSQNTVKMMENQQQSSFPFQANHFSQQSEYMQRMMLSPMPLLNIQQGKDCASSQLNQSPSYFFETGQSWTNNESSKKQFSQFNINSVSARNSRTFKFREFNLKQSQLSQQKYQEESDQNQISNQVQNRNISSEQTVRRELQMPLSDRSQLKYYQSQQNFRYPKKLQFSPQVFQNTNLYYQYINPIPMSQKEPQNSANQVDIKSSLKKKSFLSNKSESQINQSGVMNSENNISNNFRKNQGTITQNNTIGLQQKNGKSFPMNSELSNNFMTERQQLLMPQSEKDITNNKNTLGQQQKRLSIQEAQNYYAFNTPVSSVQANQLTQIPQYISHRKFKGKQDENKLQNGIPQKKQQQQSASISERESRDLKNRIHINIDGSSNYQIFSNLQHSIHSPTTDLTNLSNSQSYKVPKNINLSKAFSSPFLKKVQQQKKQKLAEVVSGGKSPYSYSQLASQTFAAFPSTQVATPNNLNGSKSGAAASKRLQNMNLNLERIKTRQSSSSSSSKSGRSLFESPLSPPPKNKLMMEMSKFKKEQKQLSSINKSNRKSLQHQNKNTLNNFIRIKKAETSSHFYVSDSKISTSNNQNPQTAKSQIDYTPNKTLNQIPNLTQYSESNPLKNSLTEFNQNESPTNRYSNFNEDSGVNFNNQNQQSTNQLQAAFVETPQNKNLNNLQKKYHESYKKIENIIEENKYFQSINKIEEEMLSVTMKNKNLLPRKLGILSLQQTKTEGDQFPYSARNFKDTSYQNIEDMKQVQSPSLANIDKDQVTDQAELKSQFKIPDLTQGSFKNRQSIKVPNDDFEAFQMLNNMSLINLDSIQSKKDGKIRQKLNLSHQNISNNYSEMLAKAFSHKDLQFLHTLNLSNNHLNGIAVLTISRNLPESIHSIDFSNNNIGAEGTRGLIPLFDSKKFNQLRKLNLENNNITDIGLKAIIPHVFSNMSIYVLNISHNKLSDQSCEFIKKLLMQSSYLQELYLHWNKISSKGGILIAQGLSENLNIKVLDLSHNGLGSIPKLKCGMKIIQSCNVLESAVKHLDISYNQFTHQECVDMSTALMQNRVLFGVHLEGNESQALVDPRGFVFFPENQNKKYEENHQNDIQIVTQRIESVKTKGPNKLQSFDCKTFDNCWICHGWTEIRFEMRDTGSDVFTGEPAFLHLDFEDYQPIYMDRDPEDPSCFFLNRMCPPNRKITFFFSDPCKNVIYFSKDYKIQEFQIPEEINLNFYDIPTHHHPQKTNDENKNSQNQQQDKKDDQKKKGNKAEKSKKKEKQKQGSKSQKDKQDQTPTAKESNKDQAKNQTIQQKEISEQELKEQKNEEIEEALDELTKNIKKNFKVKYLDGTIIEYHAPTYVNYVETQVCKEIISKKRDYEANVKAKPRQPETYFRISKTDQWHRGISLFRDYIPDSDALDKRCFEFDWQSSKLPKILEKGKDIEDCKKILQSVYPLLRNAYKYLSCTGIANDVFCITQNPFSNFTQKAQIIDNNLLFIRDIDFNFISASNIALKAKTYRNPDKALIRNEFLEVMGRIALDKYIRNEKAKANAEAMKMFFYEEGLLNHLYEFDSPQEWRKTRYWNQECDEKLKAYLPFLKTLYNNFADSRKNEKRYFTTTKSMSLQEFKDMVYKFDLLDDLLVERDIIISFNLAMMTQVDELNNDRHFQMQFVEFLEALSRLAEKKSMVPLGEIAEEYEVHERIVIKLPYKIESLLALMKKKYESFSIKESSSNQNSAQQQVQQQQQQISQQQQNVLQGVVQLLKKKSLLQNNTSTNSQRQINKMNDESINFIKRLTMKRNTQISDDQKEQDKLNLKSVIQKIMNKDILKNKSNTNSPSKSPGKSPKKQLLKELEQMKQQQNQSAQK